MKNYFYTFLTSLIISLCINLSAFSQWSAASLSVGRQEPTATSVGTKALFAGGYYYTSPNNITTHQGVDIYDDATGLWTTALLSTARTRMAATSTDSLAFFAGGGYYVNNGSTPVFSYSSRVDIYNKNTNQWVTAELSQARANMVAVSAGGKVLFAGGSNSSSSNLSTVDIYDVATNQWSTTDGPSGDRLSVASVGNKVYFKGGYSLYIYDVITGKKEAFVYNQPIIGISAVSLEDRIFFAGGYGSYAHGKWNTSRVDILNTIGLTQRLLKDSPILDEGKHPINLA